MNESPVTRSELKGELTSLETRLLESGDRLNHETRASAKAELQSLETRLLEHTERVRLEILERTEKVETTLLREFRKWGISFESRFKANDALIFGFNERLISVEERLSDLEQK